MKLTIKGRLYVFLLINSLLLTRPVLAQQTYTLEQFRRLAMERNNNLKIAEQNIAVAKAQKAQADASGKFTIDGTAEHAAAGIWYKSGYKFQSAYIYGRQSFA